MKAKMMGYFTGGWDRDDYLPVHFAGLCCPDCGTPISRYRQYCRQHSNFHSAKKQQARKLAKKQVKQLLAIYHAEQEREEE